MNEENLIKAMEYGAYIKKALSIAVNVGCGFEGDAEDAAKLLSLITFHESRIAELEAAQRWIPVSERLPEDLQPTVIITKGGMTGIVRYLELYGREGFGSWSEDVTYWMPLPEPPEVQQ